MQLCSAPGSLTRSGSERDSPEREGGLARMQQPHTARSRTTWGSSTGHSTAQPEGGGLDPDLHTLVKTHPMGEFYQE